MNTYRYKHCGKVRRENRTVAWYKSYCTKTGRNVHMTLVKQGGNRKPVEQRGR